VSDPSASGTSRAVPGAVGPAGDSRPAWSPWRVIAGFGVVSLCADMVY